ncbi:hypothetical protein SCUCBS95973_003694 [Sporothrix curviconia]|uniref:Glycosyl transferase n=1 Tax=Sporothrix curviconia TaxID=1260050 RepID=A0ABP0BHL6_9PEZI
MHRRTESSGTEHILVPQALISTAWVGRSPHWIPYRRDHALSGDGPVQNVIREAVEQPQRWRQQDADRHHDQHSNGGPGGRRHPRSKSFTAGTSSDGPYDHDVGRAEQRHQQQMQQMWIGRPRKTSNPITLEESRRATIVSPALSLTDRENYGLTSAAASVLSLSDTLSQFRFHHHLQHNATYGSNLSDGSTIVNDNSDNNNGSEKSSEETVDDNDNDDEEDEDRDSVVSNGIRRTRTQASRHQNLHEAYERAKKRGLELERKPWARVLFEYTVYFLLLSFIYFILVGRPLWLGAVFWLYWAFSFKMTAVWGWSITMGIALILAFAPLLVIFEKTPELAEDDVEKQLDRNERPGVRKTALLIPCYKSAKVIGPTLQAALRIFPPSHIFVIANGNSPTPLDNTEEICRLYGVNHIWSPVGSKIVAQFVGCYAASTFENVLLVDDDCALPPNFPVVSDRLAGQVQCIGYTIKSTGGGGSRGTWCQQAQDLEYKLSGLQRAFAGTLGSATFPHGAISLWRRQFLIRTFYDHPGFSVSEDWFFGHSCRRLGGRIKMCTSVFVETETPSAVFFPSRGSGSRGGFGEMTVFKQRFQRWNFFFVNGMWYNMGYVLGSWKLGWWEIGAKIFVLQEVYETFLYLLAPFVLPISFIVRPAFCGYLMSGTLLLYFVNVVVFNVIHLRMRKESVNWGVCLLYYPPYKLALTAVNVASCYWSLFKYARYFAKRHPKVVEDERAMGVVLRLEETTPAVTRINSIKNADDDRQMGRRLAVTAATAVRTIPAASTDKTAQGQDAAAVGVSASLDTPAAAAVLCVPVSELCSSSCANGLSEPVSSCLASAPVPVAVPTTSTARTKDEVSEKQTPKTKSTKWRWKKKKTDWSQNIV